MAARSGSGGGGQRCTGCGLPALTRPPPAPGCRRPWARARGGPARTLPAHWAFTRLWPPPGATPAAHPGSAPSPATRVLVAQAPASLWLLWGTPFEPNSKLCPLVPPPAVSACDAGLPGSTSPCGPAHGVLIPAQTAGALTPTAWGRGAVGSGRVPKARGGRPFLRPLERLTLQSQLCHRLPGPAILPLTWTARQNPALRPCPLPPRLVCCTPQRTVSTLPPRRPLWSHGRPLNSQRVLAPALPPARGPPRASSPSLPAIRPPAPLLRPHTQGGLRDTTPRPTEGLCWACSAPRDLPLGRPKARARLWVPLAVVSHFQARGHLCPRRGAAWPHHVPWSSSSTLETPYCHGGQRSRRGGAAGPCTDHPRDSARLPCKAPTAWGPSQRLLGCALAGSQGPARTLQ